MLLVRPCLPYDSTLASRSASQGLGPADLALSLRLLGLLPLAPSLICRVRRGCKTPVPVQLFPVLQHSLPHKLWPADFWCCCLRAFQFFASLRFLVLFPSIHAPEVSWSNLPFKLPTEDKTKEVELTLEEDDLFEEFDKMEAEDEPEGPQKLWAPEWEDEEIGDDFASRLKAELKGN